MKGLKIFFLVLLGFLFVSVAEAKTDIQVSDGFEITINTLDFDLVAMDFQAITTRETIKGNLFYFVATYLKAIDKTKFATKDQNLLGTRRLSNPGKLTNLTSYNYSNSLSSNNRFKIPYGLRYEQKVSVII